MSTLLRPSISIICIVIQAPTSRLQMLYSDEAALTADIVLRAARPTVLYILGGSVYTRPLNLVRARGSRAELSIRCRCYNYQESTMSSIC